MAKTAGSRIAAETESDTFRGFGSLWIESSHDIILVGTESLSKGQLRILAVGNRRQREVGSLRAPEAPVSSCTRTGGNTWKAAQVLERMEQQEWVSRRGGFNSKWAKWAGKRRRRAASIFVSIIDTSQTDGAESGGL